MGMIPAMHDLARMTYAELEARKCLGVPLVALVPVGSVEPHGPHLPLGTDTTISTAACVAALVPLVAAGLDPVVAPAVPFGVTRCADGFAGAISVDAAALGAYLQSLVRGFIHDGFAHVCLVNNHLEPEHDAAVRAVAEAMGSAEVSVACPLDRRWARTLSDEFKRGECHAGEYETAIVLAADPTLVRESLRAQLPEVRVSLSEKLKAGVARFEDMGLDQAYAGNPAVASAEHGRDMIAQLATMIAAVVVEKLAT